MITLLFMGARALAGAVPEVDLQRWSMPADSQGAFWTRDASAAPLGWATGGLAVGWQHEPLVYRYGDGREEVLIQQATQVSLVGAVSFGRVMAGVDLPAMLGVRGDDLSAPPALGDVSVEARLSLLDPQARAGLALLGQVWVPTTSGELTPWASEQSRAQVGLAGHRDLGDLRMALNLGTRLQPRAAYGDQVLDDALDLRAGAVWRPIEALSLSGDLTALLSYAEPSLLDGGSPVEALLGVSTWFGDGWTAGVAAGAGLNDGIGAPQARLIASVRYTPKRVWDAPSEAVAVEPLASLPPPPPPPVVAPAPPPAPPAIGVIEVRVTGPDHEPIEATWTADGAPRSTLRGGVGQIELPAGAHSLEVSAPGFVAASFQIEVQAGGQELLNLSLRPAAVTITRERLVITERIYFDTNRATLRPVSLAVLDEVAEVLMAHPEIQRLRVEGHTDAQGPDLVNLRLSELRAAAVRDYLVSRGVAAERLSAVGYGETRPLEGAATPDSELNRRVEFVIERWTS